MEGGYVCIKGLCIVIFDKFLFKKYRGVFPVKRQKPFSLLLALTLVFIAVISDIRPALAALPLLPGQAITTQFSGTVNSVKTPVLSGNVVTVLDIRDPVGKGAKFGMPGWNNWNVPKYQNSSWIASSLGEVFGIALDSSKNNPDIYLTSSSSQYFESTSFNMTPGNLAGTYGGVFKINGTTGGVSLLANLPSLSFAAGGYK